MSWILQALGIIFLILLMIILAVYWFYRVKIRPFLQMTDDIPMVSAINLNEDLQPAWLQEPRALQLVQDFTLNGFSKGNAYLIQQMPEVFLLSFVNQEENITGVLYHHKQLQYWIDLTAEYEDQASFTVSSSPMGQEIKSPPFSSKIYRPGETLTGLLAIFREKRPRFQGLDASIETFRDRFEESFAREMKWRMGHGGTSMEELRHSAQLAGQKLTEEQLLEAHLDLQLQNLEMLHEDCIATYARSKQASEEQQEEMLYHYFIVTDAVKPSVFIDYLDDHMEFSERQHQQYKEIAEDWPSTIDFFQRLNTSLSQGLRAKKLGEITDPVEAHIYTQPN